MTGVYHGIKILELGAGAAGPVATGLFAEHGATVIRIESAARPDFLRLLHVTAQNRNDPGILDRAPMFALFNANKQSVTLNLKEPEARELVWKLVDWADVLCENFAPGVMARFGLDPALLAERRDDLIVVSGCLFGQTGPQRSYPGFGGQGSAIAGFNHMTGSPDDAAHGPYGTITDSLAPRYVALMIAAALHARRNTGRGQLIDVSQIETGVYSLSEMIVRASANDEVMTRRGNRHEDAVPHGVYPCQGHERYVAIAVRNQDQWQTLISVMGRAELGGHAHFSDPAARRENEDELDREIAAWTTGKDAYELMHLLQAQGIEAGVVQNQADLLADPQLAQREHFVEREHAVLGSLPFERSGFRVAGAPAGGIETPGPLLGEHNGSILEEIAGLDSDAINDLTNRGVVG